MPSTIKNINNSAFSSCDNLRKVTLPSSITILEANVFMFCESLDFIYISSSIKDLDLTYTGIDSNATIIMNVLEVPQTWMN